MGCRGHSLASVTSWEEHCQGFQNVGTVGLYLELGELRKGENFDKSGDLLWSIVREWLVHSLRL